MATNNKTIHIFGNPLLDFDNLPIKLANELRKKFSDIDFIIQDPNENIKPSSKGELLIIDTVAGIDEITVIRDIESLETETIYSMHDFDLAFNLKLLKKIGRLKKVTIFGVPQRPRKRNVLKQLTEAIEKHLNFA